MKHLRSLVKQYGDNVNFQVIVMSGDEYTAEEIQNKFNLDIPVLFDGAIAKTCGVDATPQAVIIQPDSELYFRGNYNKSCVAKSSEHACKTN